MRGEKRKVRAIMKNNISHDTTGGQEMGERAAGGQDGWETIHVCCGEK